MVTASSLLLNRLVAVQGCDATGGDSSTAADYTKNKLTLKPLKKKLVIYQIPPPPGEAGGGRITGTGHWHG
jgi:hypothetical protein